MSIFSQANTFLRYHAHRFGHIRFEEPIVVIESDDWGKVHGNPHGIYPDKYGQRTIWSYDQLESESELEALFALLKSYENKVERAPVFTANFIISNPDVEETQKGDYQKLVLKPIDKQFPELFKAWKNGHDQNVFFPQYHGKLHYNVHRYQTALQQDERVRFLFDQNINGGLENFKHETLAFYSEYFNYLTEKPIDKLSVWLTSGLVEFERIFGYKSESTIAPNYVVHPNSLPHFAEAGIKFMQASNKFFRSQNGKEIINNYCLGTTLVKGLTAITRNHKFEPCRNKKEWEAAFSLKSAHGWFNLGVPFILDTHRLNYVGKFAEQSRQQLKTLLDDLTTVKGIQFLTTTELGEAIANNGHYFDAFSKKPKRLTPKDHFLRKVIRQNLS